MSVIKLKFDKGDKVRIINSGLAYTGYGNAMTYFKVNTFEMYDMCWFSWADFDGQCYTVENVCLNSHYNNRPLYLIHCDKRYIMIDEDGIDFYNYAYERRHEYWKENGKSSFNVLVII